LTAQSLRVLAASFANDDYLRAMQRFAADFSQYRARLPHIPYSYTRTCLYATPQYEIVAMHWSPGSTSPVHDHGLSRCWVLMLEGALDVENFVRSNAAADEVALEATSALVLQSGDVDHRFGPLELHRVHNSHAQAAYSLQLYAGPITSYTIVDPHTNKSRIATATFDLDLSR
jgi:cysteine dioxygenase